VNYRYHYPIPILIATKNDHLFFQFKAQQGGKFKLDLLVIANGTSWIGYECKVDQDKKGLEDAKRVKIYTNDQRVNFHSGLIETPNNIVAYSKTKPSTK
jgi:hypothetical protein